MAVFKNAFLSIAGNPHSAALQSLTLAWGAETVDDTAMADNTRSTAGGMKTWEVSGVVHFAAGSSSIDAELGLLLLASSTGTAALIVRPDAGVKSVTNPEYTGTGLLTEYSPMSGGVGDQQLASFKFVAASDLVRDAS